MSVLVTGATGTVGSRVVKQLRGSDTTVRAAVRDPTDARVPNGVASVAFDFEKPETWGPAFAGVDAMFLIRPPEMARVHEWITPAIDAAIRSGVGRIVFLSVLGAEKLPVVPHRRIEKHLAGADAETTFLRASFFMENLTEVHGDEIRDHGEIVVPAGNGRTSFVAADDIAAVAASALTEAGHAGESYDVTGPESLTYQEVADLFADELGREVRYTEPSLREFARHSRRLGRDWSFIGAMAVIYTTARLGLADSVTEDFEHILGRSPTTLQDWLQDTADEFRTDANRAIRAEQ